MKIPHVRCINSVRIGFTVFLSMGEDKDDCFCVNLKCLWPVSWVFDLFHCFSCSILELYSSNELNFSVVIGDGDMPKGHGCNRKQWVKEGWIRVEALLRLWGYDNGVSNNSLLVWQQGVSEEDSKNVEQYADYSNYGSLIDDRNDRYERGEMKILLCQRGEEKTQGELGCMKQSVRCGERCTKHEVSGLERMKLIKAFRKVIETWSWEGKLLLPFHMVSTAIKYKMLCQQFHHEPHDMVICE